MFFPLYITCILVPQFPDQGKSEQGAEEYDTHCTSLLCLQACVQYKHVTLQAKIIIINAVTVFFMNNHYFSIVAVLLTFMI